MIYNSKNCHYNPISKGNHIQDDIQNPNLSYDNQYTAHTIYSNTLLVPTRVITEQETQRLPQGTSILSTNITTIQI